MCGVISSSPLLELYLRWNRIRGKGAVGFALGLSQNTFLETLDLSWNALGAGAIRSISFRGRFHKGDDAISALCVALEVINVTFVQNFSPVLSSLQLIVPIEPYTIIHCDVLFVC